MAGTSFVALIGGQLLGPFIVEDLSQISYFGGRLVIVTEAFDQLA